LRLYCDENFPLPVVVELRRLGHDVLTTDEAGKADQEIADYEVLSFATALDRPVLTINCWDFIRLHRLRADHAGIVACTIDLDFVGQASRIHEAIRDSASLSGQLIRVNRPAR